MSTIKPRTDLASSNLEYLARFASWTELTCSLNYSPQQMAQWALEEASDYPDDAELPSDPRMLEQIKIWARSGPDGSEPGDISCIEVALAILEVINSVTRKHAP